MFLVYYLTATLDLYMIIRIHCYAFVYNSLKLFLLRLNCLLLQVAGVIDVLFITCQTRLKGKLDSVLSKQTITTPKVNITTS